MIYKYCNPGNDFAIFRVGDVLEHGPTPNIEVHIWHPAVGLRCRYKSTENVILGKTFKR